jgi:1-aminocyclopropane-1-carboxylate deaminase/D-cysteine desulfhydrase-like pyridoxal-dependent ACC family enzyme
MNGERSTHSVNGRPCQTELGPITTDEVGAGHGKLKLINQFTPFEELVKFSSYLGGPRIWVKREDLISFAMGGNKVRKMEFYLAEALEMGADTVVSIGAEQSNHTRAASAACARLGLKSVVLVMGKRPEKIKGNLLLNQLLKARLIYLNRHIDNFEERAQAMQTVAARYEEKGYKVSILPVSGERGCLGPYFACREMLSQAEAINLPIRHQIVAVGSGESFVGMQLAAAQKGNVKTHGICIGRRVDQMLPIVHTLYQKAFKLIQKMKPAEIPTFRLYDDYLGTPGVPSDKSRAAIRKFACLEGVFLDPIYTGKVMVGLMDLVKKREVSKDETVVFWHTGNPSMFFAYEGIFQ